MTENELNQVPAVVGGNEVGRSVPLILQYLQVVDFMTTNFPPNKTGRGDYLDIHFFAKEEMNSRANILRLVVEYQDFTGLQDEIWIRNKEHGYQINAERNPQGEYTKYHEPEGWAKEHLEEAIKIINGLKTQDGSFIVIDHKTAFVSRGGVWESTTPVKQKSNLPLGPGNPRLEGPDQ